MKEQLRRSLEAAGHDLVDFSAAHQDDTDDYSPLAHQVAEYILANPGSQGILLCRSGEGMVMTANRHPGIRAALATSSALAIESRQDNDANIVVLPADFITQDQAEEIVSNFIHTQFSQLPRHSRRIEAIERQE